MKTKIALSVMSILAVVFFVWLLVEKNVNTDLNSQLDQVKRTLAGNEQDLREARSTLTETEDHLTKAQRSIDQLKQEKNSLTAELQRSKSSLDSARTSLRSAENDLIMLKKYETEVVTARTDLETVSKRLKELEPLEAEVAALRQALAEAETQAAESRRTSEWAIRDEEVEKLVSGGPEKTAGPPNDLEVRIRELEARLAECESSRRPAEADSGQVFENN